MLSAFVRTLLSAFENYTTSAAVALDAPTGLPQDSARFRNDAWLGKQQRNCH